MSQQLEKIYRVDSFDGILQTINRLGATPTLEVFTTHYYAHLETDDTLKMVDYKDRVEVHKLSIKDGLYRLDEVITVNSVEDGCTWFKEHGYDVLDVLEMHDREYAYETGGIALYDVDSAINSVILGYAEELLPEMEHAFGLQSAEEINIPYNKYLRNLGKLRTITI